MTALPASSNSWKGLVFNMGALEIKLENGKVSVTNLYGDKSIPVSLTEKEVIATGIVENALQEIGVPSTEICFRRNTEKYLSVVSHDVYDFLRIKAGEKSVWFTVFLSPDLQQKFKDDPRFTAQKNKNQLHWKVSLSSVQELENNKDLIQLGYKSAIWSFEKTTQN